MTCKYKAFLTIKGEAGTKSDFELLDTRLTLEHIEKAIAKTLQRCDDHAFLETPELSPAILKQGKRLILRTQLETETVELYLPLLERASHKGRNKSSYYIPVLVSRENVVPVTEKIILALCEGDR